MRYVDGLVLRTRPTASVDAGARPPSSRVAVHDDGHHSRRQIDAARALRVRPAGRLHGPAAGQRWQRQWELSKTREMPGYDELVAGCPPACRSRPRARWCTATSGWTTRWSRLGDPAKIAAVVDWEMSTLGDPLADLGLTLVVLDRPADRGSRTSTSAPRSRRCPASTPAAVRRPVRRADRPATSPGSATTSRSAASSSRSCWRASTPGTCRARPWVRASTERARRCRADRPGASDAGFGGQV